MQPVALIPVTAVPGEALQLRALDCHIRIRCPATPELFRALDTAFGGLRSGPFPDRADLDFAIRQTDTGFVLESGAASFPADDLGDLLYLLDKEITLGLQRLRKDLCFVHGGAVMAADGRVVVITAASGSGKSTMTWALLHHGFGYLSDELAPIDPATLMVHGYPHALCLKRRPPAPYSLPAETLATTRTWHIPVAATPASGRLAAVLFVGHRYPEGHPVLTGVPPARAAIQLYANTLNPLAHPNDGLDAVARIAQHAPGFELNSANLDAACMAIKSWLDHPHK